MIKFNPLLFKELLGIVLNSNILLSSEVLRNLFLVRVKLWFMAIKVL